MRVTVDLNEDALKAAMAITGEKYKVRAVRRVLQSYVRWKRIEQLRSMAGSLEVADELQRLEELEAQEMRELLGGEK